MRHAIRSQRLGRPSDQREALVHNMVKGLVVHGQITTTYARAKEAQRLADRLVTLGKDGSVHARRQALRVLQDRTLVKRLFAEIAPRFVDAPGGYTRVLRLGLRPGDGAQEAVLAFSRLPVEQPAVPKVEKAAPAPKAPPSPERPTKEKAQPKKPSKFFEGLRHLWTRREKGGSGVSPMSP